MTRERRLVFGEDAELYDRARPGYSDELVSGVLEFLGATSAVQALEIGAGTGKATVAFAARGVDIVAVEPDAAMAAVAARNTARYPGVRIEHAAFEDVALGDRRVDLVFSAQAWHWVRPEVRVPKAAGVLRPGGALALFWHRTRWSGQDPVWVALDACYREHAPALRALGPGFPGLDPGRDRREHEEIASSPLFVDVTVRRYPWEAETGAEEFLALLSTQSDHRMLATATRRRLLDAVGHVVDGFGGTIRVPYDTLLVLARAAT